MPISRIFLRKGSRKEQVKKSSGHMTSYVGAEEEIREVSKNESEVKREQIGEKSDSDHESEIGLLKDAETREKSHPIPVSTSGEDETAPSIENPESKVIGTAENVPENEINLTNDNENVHFELLQSDHNSRCASSCDEDNDKSDVNDSTVCPKGKIEEVKPKCEETPNKVHSGILMDAKIETSLQDNCNEQPQTVSQVDEDVPVAMTEKTEDISVKCEEKTRNCIAAWTEQRTESFDVISENSDPTDNTRASKDNANLNCTELCVENVTNSSDNLLTTSEVLTSLETARSTHGEKQLQTGVTQMPNSQVTGNQSMMEITDLKSEASDSPSGSVLPDRETDRTLNEQSSRDTASFLSDQCSGNNSTMEITESVVESPVFQINGGDSEAESAEKLTVGNRVCEEEKEKNSMEIEKESEECLVSHSIVNKTSTPILNEMPTCDVNGNIESTLAETPALQETSSVVKEGEIIQPLDSVQDDDSSSTEINAIGNESEAKNSSSELPDQKLDAVKESKATDQNCDLKNSHPSSKKYVSKIPAIVSDDESSDNNVDAQEKESSKNAEDSAATEDSSPVLSDSDDLGDSLPERPSKTDEPKTSWKVGHLQVKVPSKSRGRGKLKVWQQRWVVVQADEFMNDPSHSSLVMSVYGSESGSSRALFWHSLGASTAIVYRSRSRSRKFAFTVAQGDDPLLHLAADSESEAQRWMAAIRAILWPPNQVLELEKVLSGQEFEVSVIDTDFSYHAGLLGAYGYLTVTTRKLILRHPQTGHVIQEWYLNTVDRFQLLPQPKEEDTNKVLLMHTSSESSTGCGKLHLFCVEAVSLLRSVAATIHQVLQLHGKLDGAGLNSGGGRYRRELAELADWLTPQPSPLTERSATSDENYYQVPKRQVRSLLDIPNFIFDKPLPNTEDTVTTETESNTLTSSKTCVSTFSEDSGISEALPADDFLNCSVTSFTIGGGHGRGRSSSESSESYSPPSSPMVDRRQPQPQTPAKAEILATQDAG